MFYTIFEILLKILLITAGIAQTFLILSMCIKEYGWHSLLYPLYFIGFFIAYAYIVDLIEAFINYLTSKLSKSTKDTSTIDIQQYTTPTTFTITLKNGLSIEIPMYGYLYDKNSSDYNIELWKYLRQYIIETKGYRCADSNEHCNGSLQLHHIKWLGKGGSNLPHNLIFLCKYHHVLNHSHIF